MALTNEEYERIMREYSRRQTESRHILDTRRAEVYARLPRLSQIDREISGASAAHIRKMLSSGEKPDISSLRETTGRLEAEKKAVLAQGGYPEDYLSLPCFCPVCHDTGYTADGAECACFRRTEIDLLYRQDYLWDILKEENFEAFSLEWYSDTMRDSATGLTARELAENARRTALEFTEHFDEGFYNMFLYGDTGTGKTFLSHCIASSLLDSGHTVLYFSAADLFERLAEKTFQEGRDKNGGIDESLLTDCDLLIIDDLGTELTNAFVSSQLFLYLNERLSRQKSTVISTNLSLQDFAETYSERIFSRIASTYSMCKLSGQDIRVLKRMNGGIS